MQTTQTTQNDAQIARATDTLVAAAAVRMAPEIAPALVGALAPVDLRSLWLALATQGYVATVRERERVAADVADLLSVETIAEHVDAQAIASALDLPELASALDLDALAQAMDLDALADRIADRFADRLSKRLFRP